MLLTIHGREWQSDVIDRLGEEHAAELLADLDQTRCPEHVTQRLFVLKAFSSLGELRQIVGCCCDKMLLEIEGTVRPRWISSIGPTGKIGLRWADPRTLPPRTVVDRLLQRLQVRCLDHAWTPTLTAESLAVFWIDAPCCANLRHQVLRAIHAGAQVASSVEGDIA